MGGWGGNVGEGLAMTAGNAVNSEERDRRGAERQVRAPAPIAAPPARGGAAEVTEPNSRPKSLLPKFGGGHGVARGGPRQRTASLDSPAVHGDLSLSLACCRPDPRPTLGGPSCEAQVSRFPRGTLTHPAATHQFFGGFPRPGSGTCAP